MAGGLSPVPAVQDVYTAPCVVYPGDLGLAASGTRYRPRYTSVPRPRYTEVVRLRYTGGRPAIFTVPNN